MQRPKNNSLTALYTRIPTSLADSLDGLAMTSGRAKQQIVTELFERALTAEGHATASEPAEVLTLDEVANLLRVEPADVVTAVDSNGLPGRRLGSEWRFSRSAVTAWLNQPEPRADRTVGFAGSSKPTSRTKASK